MKNNNIKKKIIRNMKNNNIKEKIIKIKEK